MNLKSLWKLTKDTVAEWQEDKVPLLAASLSYYTLFSLAPLLIIAIAIAGAVFGEEAARGQIVGQISSLVGQQGAETIQGMIANAASPKSGIIAAVVGVITLVLGASGVFGQLQEALNIMWGVKPKPGQGIVGIARARFLSLAMVLVIAFLLLVSLVITAGLAALGTFFGNVLPIPAFIWQIVNLAIAFGVVTLLFAMIYKFLPDAEIAWKDVWIGAAVTSLLFSIGRLLIGLYLGSSSVGSTYGAAGSLVVILVWVYYSAQILLFGAEFTQVYARRYGSKIVPTKNAVPIDQGLGAKDGVVEGGEELGKQSHQRSTATAAIERPQNSQPKQNGRPPYGRYAATVLGSIVALAGIFRNSKTSRSQNRSRWR